MAHALQRRRLRTNARGANSHASHLRGSVKRREQATWADDHTI
jgi:hypothetical protein